MSIVVRVLRLSQTIWDCFYITDAAIISLIFQLYQRLSWIFHGLANYFEQLSKMTLPQRKRSSCGHTIDYHSSNFILNIFLCKFIVFQNPSRLYQGKKSIKSMVFILQTCFLSFKTRLFYKIPPRSFSHYYDHNFNRNFEAFVVKDLFLYGAVPSKQSRIA